MVGRLSRPETFLQSAGILRANQLQNLFAERSWLGMVGRPSRAAMLQTARSFLPVAPPKALGLTVAELQNLRSIQQSQRPAGHLPEHFHASQLLGAHGCPLHRTLLRRLQFRGHFYRGQKGTLSKRFNSRTTIYLTYSGQLLKYRVYFCYFDKSESHDKNWALVAAVQVRPWPPILGVQEQTRSYFPNRYATPIPTDQPSGIGIPKSCSRSRQKLHLAVNFPEIVSRGVGVTEMPTPGR